jgi:hypothetical protein
MTIAERISGRLERLHRPALAFQSTPPRGANPTFVWLCGFKSDITGTKTSLLHDWAEAEGFGYLAFDYSGHGASDGRFEDGTISVWRQDALDMIDTHTSGPLVLVGSSMGGWLALLAALARPDRVNALVLIAPAPDFTEKLMWPEFSGAQKREIEMQGQTLRSSDYGAPYPITRALIDDGRTWNLLDGPIALLQPVRILQGMQDAAVPWPHALTLIEKLDSRDAHITLIKDGDHRLSRPEDIELLKRACADMAALA